MRHPVDVSPQRARHKHRNSLILPPGSRTTSDLDRDAHRVNVVRMAGADQLTVTLCRALAA